MARKRFEEHPENPADPRHRAASDPQDITATHEPAVPGVGPTGATEPPVGARPVKSGKVAAIIAACALLVGVVALTVMIVSVRDLAAVEIDRVSESIDTTDGCDWKLSIELRNTTDDRLTVTRITAIINRGIRTGTIEKAPRLAAGQTGTFLVTFPLLAPEGCPAVDEVDHGNLIFRLADGSSESVRF